LSNAFPKFHFFCYNIGWGVNQKKEDIIMEQVDLNTVSAAELEALPGIGTAYARRIIEYREEHGPFTDPAQIKEVRGIGEALYASLSDLLTVGAEEEEEVAEVAEVEETPPIETAPPPPPEAPPPTRREGVPWLGGLLRSLAIIALSTLLAVAISLGVFYSYNATLDISQHRDVVGLKSQARTLEREREALRSDLEDLIGRTERLEGRIKELETLRDDVESLQGEVKKVGGEVEKVRGEMKEVRAEVEAVAAKAAKFDRFLTTLRDLLIEIQGTPSPTTK
jgi:competence protein ComEA